MIQKTKNYKLYILKLEQDKFYVGITTQSVEKRFQEHRSGRRASYWTQQYKPIKIFDTKKLGAVTKEKAELYEAKVTRKYMRKYGINSTRGGDLTDKYEYGTILGRIYLKDTQQGIFAIAILLFVLAILAVFYI